MRIEAETGECELHHVRLADDHGSGLPQPAHDARVTGGGCRIAQGNGARCGSFASDIEQILDRDDRSVERSQLHTGLSAGIGRVGRHASCIFIQLQEHTLIIGSSGQSDQDVFQLVSRRPHGATKLDGSICRL